MLAKLGVDVRTLSAEAWYAAFIADQVRADYDDGEITITSTTEGKHSVERSAHYRGDAIDIRIRDMASPVTFADQLKNALGDDYVVLLERDHIHVHWSPIYRG